MSCINLFNKIKLDEIELRQNVKLHLQDIFCSFLLELNLSRPQNKAFEFFQFFSWIRWHVQIFSHLAVTQLMWSPISCQLSQRQVRHHINRVNTEWDSMSTEPTWNNEIFINIDTFRIDQLMWSLTLHGLNRLVVYPALTQLTCTWIVPKLKMRTCILNIKIISHLPA
jgi:hypothetical protein